MTVNENNGFLSGGSRGWCSDWGSRGGLCRLIKAPSGPKPQWNPSSSAVGLTLKMCAFRMWWPSSMVCWRFSLPSCRENMKARRACPFLGQETQRLVTRDPGQPSRRPSGGTLPHTPLNCSPGVLASPYKMGGKLPLHRRWSMPFILQVALRAFSGFPTLWSDSEWSPRTGEVFTCGANHSLFTVHHSLTHLLIYVYHQNVNSMRLRVA